MVQILSLKSTNLSHDALFLSNFASINIVEELKRIDGIGDVQNLGEKKYSMRIWINPNKENVEPRYGQIKINYVNNEFKQILSPSPNDDGVWIHQNAWFHLGEFNKEIKITHKLKDKNNGIYIFIIEGSLTINGEGLEKRDGIGIWETDKIELNINSNSKILLMEIPMDI